MFVVLYAIACLDLSNPNSCVREQVTSAEVSAISFEACMGAQGLNAAKDFIAGHARYRSWQVKGWTCGWSDKIPVHTDGV